jgi:hypothetical protein
MVLAEETIIELQRRVAYIPGPDTISLPATSVPEIRAPLVELPSVTVPATWWDHFKSSNFDILLRWFPVRYKIVQQPRTIGGEVLQEAATIGGKDYQARMYLPDVIIPKSEKVYRWHSFDA